MHLPEPSTLPRKPKHQGYSAHQQCASSFPRCVTLDDEERPGQDLAAEGGAEHTVRNLNNHKSCNGSNDNLLQPTERDVIRPKCCQGWEKSTRALAALDPLQCLRIQVTSVAKSLFFFLFLRLVQIAIRTSLLTFAQTKVFGNDYQLHKSVCFWQPFLWKHSSNARV